jgi:phospholipid/cholesterol/gamma-HCH transport system ATP-binding protein
MIGRDEEEAKDVRRRWGILFQGAALFSTLTVAEKCAGADPGIFPEDQEDLLEEIAPTRS